VKSGICCSKSHCSSQCFVAAEAEPYFKGQGSHSFAGGEDEVVEGRKSDRFGC